jgi:transcriptional regulator with XRE-family HTH domain
MGSAALRPSTKVGALLRSRRKELKLTLREVSEKMEETGERLPVSTLVRIEQGKLEPGTRRLHLLLGLYDLPAHLVSDLVELEQLAVEEPEGKSIEQLLEDGVAHWRRGELGEGMAHLLAIRIQKPADKKSRLMKQKACIHFAAAARDVGKVKLAKQLLDELLLEPVDPSLMATALIQASVVWNALGSVEMGMAAVRQATCHVEKDNFALRASIKHQEAKLLLRQNNPAAGLEAMDQAVRLYRKVGNIQGVAKVMIIKSEAQAALGDLDAGMRTARKVMRLGEEHDLGAVGTSARMEYGQLLVRSGAVESGIAELREVLAEAVRLECKMTQFHTHYHLWKAYDESGDQERAKFEFQSAKYFIEFIDATTEQAQEIRSILAEQAQPKRRRGRPST